MGICPWICARGSRILDTLLFVIDSKFEIYAFCESKFEQAQPSVLSGRSSLTIWIETNVYVNEEISDMQCGAENEGKKSSES